MGRRRREEITCGSDDGNVEPRYSENKTCSLSKKTILNLERIAFSFSFVSILPKPKKCYKDTTFLNARRMVDGESDDVRDAILHDPRTHHDELARGYGERCRISK